MLISGVCEEVDRVLPEKIRQRTRNYLVTTKLVDYFLKYYNRLDFFNTREIDKDEERDSKKFFGSSRFYG